MMKISVPLGLTQDEQVLFLKDKTHGQLMKLTVHSSFVFFSIILHFQNFS